MSLQDASTWPQYATIDPEFDAALKAIGKLPSLDGPDVPTLRKIVLGFIEQAAAATGPPDYSGVKKSTIEIPTRDGSSIPALLYQPESPPSSGSPLAVLYHGGGFCVGIPEMEEPFALQLVRNNGAVAISVDYRMAPEHVFPTPITDSFDALKWAAKSAASLGADPTKGFLVGGLSAGGNISAVLSHLARDEKLNPPLTAVWLDCPALVSQEVLPEKYRKDHSSYQQNADAPLLDVKSIDFFMRNYKPVVSDPQLNPLLWPGGHKDLPPHLIQCAGLDPLRDDSLIYSRELKEQGVQVTTFVYQGVPHGFGPAFPQISAAQKFVKDRAEWVTAQLGKR
ncbi:uncharacterized protein PV09_00082 [Verruconis gallopava]|uniref:Alpha/beta hydrolase fold-3 domain-containing protein n=1 Tax=Verruconis gallopava TaxID=253628 RepID=A0A0D1Y267_9PEZI|nr:uncharacterized protein PV09_00082 [Verruconis gallopava]KIW09146.1 hypothetical protein PV09_00082 [Verruconis gallopava]